jgi:hypothetical protein
MIMDPTALTLCAAAWAGTGYLLMLALDRFNR